MLTPAVCPWGQLAWPVSTSLTSPASRAGSNAQTPPGSGPSSVQHLICAQSPQNNITTQQCCAISQGVALLGFTPGTDLTISQDMVNDCSGHEQSCCQSCRARTVLGCTGHRKCLRCDQAAPAVCIQILPAHLKGATVLAKVEEQIPVRVITFLN